MMRGHVRRASKTKTAADIEHVRPYNPQLINGYLRPGSVLADDTVSSYWPWQARGVILTMSRAGSDKLAALTAIMQQGKQQPKNDHCTPNIRPYDCCISCNRRTSRLGACRWCTWTPPPGGEQVLGAKITGESCKCTPGKARAVHF